MTKVGLWREYGLERPSKPRYEGLKGIYWHLFSIKVRREDFEQYDGECIDQCGKHAETWQDFDAGHFIAAGGGGFGLLFKRQNVNGQLKGCNNPTFSPNSQLGYRRGLDARYGPGTSDALEEEYRDAHLKGKITKEWTQNEYALRITELINELKAKNWL